MKASPACHQSKLIHRLSTSDGEEVGKIDCWDFETVGTGARLVQCPERVEERKKGSLQEDGLSGVTY